MTCIERANYLGLWDETTEDERKPESRLELHEILHEVLSERYGGMSDRSANKMLATMDNREYGLIWTEALNRFRVRGDKGFWHYKFMASLYLRHIL